MAEDYERYAADMARAGTDVSLNDLRRQVCELNRRVTQLESRLAFGKEWPADFGYGMARFNMI